MERTESWESVEEYEPDPQLVEERIRELVDEALSSDSIRDAIAGLGDVYSDLRANLLTEALADRSTVSDVGTLVQLDSARRALGDGEPLKALLQNQGGWLLLAVAGILTSVVAAVRLVEGPSVAWAIAALAGIAAYVSSAPKVQRTLRNTLRVRPAIAAIRAETHRREADLAGRVFLPMARRAVNALLDPAFNRDLKPRDDSGLRDLFDSKYEVPVAAADRLAESLRWLNAGSVGIAGPRGVGKTTLIRAACDGRLKVTDAEAQPAGLPIGVMVAAPVRYEAEHFIRFVFSQLCLKVLAVPPREAGFKKVPITYGAAGPLVGGLARALGYISPEEYPVRAMARKSLHRLRYLETISQERSGELGIKGAKLGERRGRSRAEQAWTHPEMIEEYQRFLAQLTERNPVVVGIDELDKMADSDEARTFLNETKSLFEQPGVFYLVSVSEDALSHFERRGQPIRDVFDSAFNDVLHVDYLSRGESEQLLRTRAIGISPPWPALFHCIAGGLPRESIRVARRAVQLAARGSTDLATVTLKLIAERASGHEHAAAVIAQKHIGGDGSQPILSWLRGLAPVLPRGWPVDRPYGKPQLEAACDALLERLQATPVVADLRAEQGYPAEVAGQLELLVMQLATSSYHALSCIEFFCELDANRFDAACTPQEGEVSAIELLARGQQDLSVSPKLAWDSVTRFRDGTNLAPHSYPATP